MFITCMPGAQRSEEDIRSPGSDGWEPPYGYWEPNLGLLQEQQVLLITDLSLHHIKHESFKFCQKVEKRLKKKMVPQIKTLLENQSSALAPT